MGKRKQETLEIWIQSMRKVALCETAREGKRCHPLRWKPIQFARKKFDPLLVRMVKQYFQQDMVGRRLHWQEVGKLLQGVVMHVL